MCRLEVALDAQAAFEAVAVAVERSAQVDIGVDHFHAEVEASHRLPDQVGAEAVLAEVRRSVERQAAIRAQV
jgi:hypothetical protein